MEDKSKGTLFNDSKFIEGYEVFEWTLQDAGRALRAYGNLMGKLFGEEKKDMAEDDFNASFGMLAEFIESDEVFVLLSAGLRKSIEEVKEISGKKAVTLLFEILRMNSDFFTKVPQMMGNLFTAPTE